MIDRRHTECVVRRGGRLLIVDDEPSQMHALCETLELEGYSTCGFSSPQQALRAVPSGEFDLLITDLLMSEMDGISLLKAAQEIDSTLEAIVTTGHGTIDSAVRAMKAGAFDFIVKPFKLNVILPVIARALDIKRLRRENAALREQVESEDRASAVMAHAAIGMALVDATGRWLKVNAAMCDTLGFTELELLAMDWRSITHPEDLEADAELLRQMLAGTIRRYQIEKRYRHKVGHFIWALLSVSLVFKPDGSVEYFVSQIQDISSRKEMDRIKREFISTMSHELRTPLTSIRGSLGLVASGVVGTLPEEVARFVQIASQNTDRLARLVNDILDVQMIEAGTMTLELASHALAPLVERAVAENREDAQHRRVRLVIPLPLPQIEARVDALRIVQVLGNLLSNATKFSPAEGVVEIEMTVNGGSVRLSVTDHGPGISTSFQHRIFRQFSQADSSDCRPNGGTGLGLAIAKALVEGMGGRIGYKTDIGIGTTFFFELPVAGEGIINNPGKTLFTLAG
ncbi:MAG TPA: ATP-binding protein [Steroidobacteraceae bacterium]